MLGIFYAKIIFHENQRYTLLPYNERIVGLYHKRIRSIARSWPILVMVVSITIIVHVPDMTPPPWGFLNPVIFGQLVI